MLNENAERFFVLTGGPGSGKSTLLDALERCGYNRSVEAGRGVIQDQVSISGTALPWGDRALFAELMLAWEMRSYRIAESLTGPVFFDRGVPDVLGYLRLIGLPVPPHVHEAAKLFRYNWQVFLAPPWREIFQQDRERKQDFEEAVRTCDVMRETYASLNYEVVEIPCGPVERRVEFVLSRIDPRLLR
jgi:predicted ATPase